MQTHEKSHTPHPLEKGCLEQKVLSCENRIQEVKNPALMLPLHHLWHFVQASSQQLSQLSC